MNIKKFLKIKKFRTRIFIWITSVMIISSIVFSIAIYLNVEKTVLGNEYENSQKILNQMKFNIDYIDEMVKNLCLSTYYSEDVKSLMNYIDDETYDQMSIINKLSNSVVASNPYVHSIYVYNNRKKVFYSTYNTFKYEDPDLIKLMKSNTEIPVLKPILRRTETYHSGELIKYSNVLTYFMYELKDSHNNMEGAVIVNIKLDWLIDNIRAINMVNSKRMDRIYIMDDKGELIQDSSDSNPENKIFEKYIKGIEATQKTEGETKKTGLTTGKINGKNYIISSIPIQEVNWVVYKVQPYDIVYDYINKLKYTIVLIVLILIILIFAAAYTLSRGLYKPFEGLLRMVGFNNGAISGAKAEGDEFFYLREVYKNSMDQLGKYSLEKRSNEKIIKMYFLRKLLFHSSSISSQEFQVNKLEHEISLSPDKPFYVILLIIDKHKEFEEKNDAMTKELLKFAITNITSEILSGSFQCEAVEMKNEEIAVIINSEKDQAKIYEQLTSLLKEAQNKVFEYYNISFTAILSEKTDKINELTILYNRAVSNSSYRFVFGACSIILPDMLKKNLSAMQHDYNYEKQGKLIIELKRGDLKAAEGILLSLLGDVKKMEYNNMMLSLAHLVNTIRNTVYDMNQTRKNPININLLLTNNEIFELETIDEFNKILLEVIQQVIIPDDSIVDDKDLKIAQIIEKIILDDYLDYNLSVSSIAERLRLSTSKVSKVYKEHLNLSIPEHINNVRLAKAVEWMENSRLSVGEIMHKVGIENESYFYKIFKAKYGSTPREYITRNIHN